MEIHKKIQHLNAQYFIQTSAVYSGISCTQEINSLGLMLVTFCYLVSKKGFFSSLAIDVGVEVFVKIKGAQMVR